MSRFLGAVILGLLLRARWVESTPPAPEAAPDPATNATPPYRGEFDGYCQIGAMG